MTQDEKYINHLEFLDGMIDIKEDELRECREEADEWDHIYDELVYWCDKREKFLAAISPRKIL